MNLDYIRNCIDNVLSFYEFVYKKLVFFFRFDDMEQILSVINKKKKIRHWRIFIY